MHTLSAQVQARFPDGSTAGMGCVLPQKGPCATGTATTTAPLLTNGLEAEQKSTQPSAVPAEGLQRGTWQKRAPPPAEIPSRTANPHRV